MPAFAGEIEVIVLRSGREIARVTRPLRNTPQGPVVKFKRRLWLVNGTTIDLDTTPLDDEADDAAMETMPGEAAIEEVSQDDIIGADIDRRMLVDAGPGTGKTYVACRRVAHLIGEGARPGRIWIISFTRTAVQELRNRMAGALAEPSDAIAVRIATLDSHAWALQSGFTTDAALTGSFNRSIETTTAQILRSEELRDYLADRVSHLIVDEAQDIVGPRAELVLALVDALAPGCGVTVFSDRAQAIYGFTEDGAALAGDQAGLLEKLAARDFRKVMISQVHRTSDPGLLSIFTSVRRQVLDQSIVASERRAIIRQEIERLSGNQAGRASDLALDKLDEHTLVLMRRRCDVLTASNFGQGIRHRLRMSGLPPRLYPWIGELLWNHEGKHLTRARFDELWTMQVTTASDASRVSAWNLLMESAGETETVIDINRLRTILGRSNPPSIFTSPEYGDTGPILGTIHASKGREADDVHLYLPEDDEEPDEYDDLDEEIRVMFVGATRARNRLTVGSSSSRGTGSLEGRVWRRKNAISIQIEVGRMHDIDAAGVTGRSTFATIDQALAAQKLLAASPHMTKLFAHVVEDLDWRMAVRTEKEERICSLSRHFQEDLAQITRICDRRLTPTYLPFLRTIGIRTMVVPPNDQALDRLHEPWRNSGFMLAPMLVGLSTTKLPADKK